MSAEEDIFRPYDPHPSRQFPGIEHTTDAKLWIHSADMYVERDNKRVGEYDDEPEYQAQIIRENRRSAHLISLLRERVNSGDAFIVRLLAEFERIGSQYNEPEEVRIMLFEDLNHLFQLIDETNKT